MRFSVIIIAFSCCAWTGCSSADKLAFGEECLSPWQCETGTCIAFPFYESTKRCSRSCSDDGDCGDGWVCTVFQSCVLYCSPPCGDPPHDIKPMSGFACVNGEPAPCFMLTEGTYCDFCPCVGDATCDTDVSPPTCIPE